jgi:hypothetical protein
MSDDRRQAFWVERSLLDLYFCATLVSSRGMRNRADNTKEWLLENFHS